MKLSRRIISLTLAAMMCLSMAIPAAAASRSPEPTERLIENARIAEELATEGIILLENNGALPIKGNSLALFGVGAARTYRGGSGSGDPWNGGLSGGGNPRQNQNLRWSVNIYDSFVKAGYNITNADYMIDLGARYDLQFGATMGGMDAFRYPEDELTAAQVAQAAAGTDTAVYVIARNAGEGSDRSQNAQNFSARINGQSNPTVSFQVGDYNLLPKEIENLRLVGAAFENVIVVVNCGGQIDTKFFRENPRLDSLVFMGEAGQEGGAALVKLLTGQRNFSGKTINTWAENYSDYPASATFGNNDGSGQDERYVEGIYVGYRYFDTAGIDPAYPFGHGLSYTKFGISVQDVTADEQTVSLKIRVKNTGSYAGKEVVQVYYSAPDGTGGDRPYQTEKPYQQLIAYAKTSLLEPGESEIVNITYNTVDMAYYNEKDEGYALDPGDYVIRVGDSSRNTHVAAVLKLDAKVITEQLKNLMHTDWRILEEREPVWSKTEKGWVPYTYAGEAAEIANAKAINLAASNIEKKTHVYSNLDETVTTYTTDPNYEPKTRGYQEMVRAAVAGANGTLGFTGAMKEYEEKAVVLPKEDIKLVDVYAGRKTLEQLVAQMSLYELATLNSGSGWGVWDENAPYLTENYDSCPGCAAETTRELEEKYGIPFYIVNDGPGGLRVRQEFQALDLVKGSPTEGERIMVYNYSTAWPVSIVRSATWNLELLNEFGYAYGKEMEAMGITIVLGTSINIHRDPLCGRNFEYYSEDPVLAGHTITAVTRGMQTTPGIGACLKHYAGNQQETRRGGGNSVMSERTAREIYLKAFEMGVKGAQAMNIMTSYNLVNDVPTADDYNLLVNITRDEWGYEGNIMTDWGGGSSTPAKSMHGGNDFITPGGPTQVRNIMRFVEQLPPAFNEKGEIVQFLNISSSGITKALDLRSNTLVAISSATGTTIQAPLGEGYTATLGNEVTGGYNEILVNGERIIRTATFSTFRGSKEDAEAGGVAMNSATYLTTQYATIENEGKALTYKYTPYNKNIDICLGDLQKSAIANLKVLMQSLGARQYFTGNDSVTVTPWAAPFDLRDYVTIEKLSDEAPVAGITAPQILDKDREITLDYGITLANVTGTNTIEIIARFDNEKLDYMNSAINIPASLGASFLKPPTYDAATGEYKATIVLLQSGALFTAIDPTKVLTVSFAVKNSATNGDEIIGNLESAKIADLFVSDVIGMSASRDPSSAATKVVNYMRFDVNKDGAVDIWDVSFIIYNYYLARSGDDNWQEAVLFDANDDGIIDLGDILIVCSYFTE